MKIDKRTLPPFVQESIKGSEESVRTGKRLDIWILDLESSLKAAYHGRDIDEATFEALWAEYFGGDE